MSSADEWEDLFEDWGVGSDGQPLACTVETFEGSGQTGPKFSAGKSRPGLPQFPQNRLVRASNGNEVLSTSKVYAPLRMAADFALHSRVTLNDGRKTTVLSVGTPDNAELFAFVEVNLE